MACVVQCTIKKGSIDTTALAGCGQEYRTMPILDIPDWTCHRCHKIEREDEGKMLGPHFFWLKEDLEAVRKNSADGGHCKMRGIRKVHWIITKPNKANQHILAVYCMWLSHTITCPFSKYFEILFLLKFSNIFPFFNISLPFFRKITTSSLYFLE